MCSSIDRGSVAATSDRLNGPISRVTFCAVDVETSALHMSSRVIEVGAVKFDTAGHHTEFQSLVNPCEPISRGATEIHGCLLYTSDAADDLLCVDLGGRRIIKKKK